MIWPVGQQTEEACSESPARDLLCAGETTVPMAAGKGGEPDRLETPSTDMDSISTASTAHYRDEQGRDCANSPGPRRHNITLVGDAMTATNPTDASTESPDDVRTRELVCRLDAALRLLDGADPVERLWSSDEAVEAAVPLLRAAREWC